MRRTHIHPIGFTVGIAAWIVCTYVQSAETLLGKLPPGMAVNKSVDVPARSAKVIGQKLGGETRRITNSFFRVQGRMVQLNVIRAVDVENAKAMAILRWLTPGRNIEYSGQTGSRWGTANVFNQKFGHCWDFSDCFVTLCRAAGVPCRQVAGWLYGSSGHVWAEFYRTGKGWHQVDPTGGGKLLCGIYHIPKFTTEDGEMPIVYLSMPKIEVLQTK